MDPILSRVSDTLPIQAVCNLSNTHGSTEFKMRYKTWLSSMLSTARKRVKEAQEGYKHNVYTRLRRLLSQSKVADYVLVEQDNDHRKKRKSKGQIKRETISLHAGRVFRG